MLGTTLTALALAALFAERRRHQASIVASEARLRSVLGAANVIAWEVDLVRNAVHTVGPVAQFLDKPDGMNNGGLEAFAARIHPEDRDRALAEFSAALNTSTDYRLEFRLPSSSGGVRWVTAEGAIERDDAGRAVSVLGITRDITARKQADDHQRVLVAELDHRVKNVLATVNAVAARTLDTSSSMDQFVAALNGRIRSMATTHELLSGRRWKGIPLAELLRHQLAPYATSNNMDVEGPDVLLSAGAGQTLGMVFHELITNAAKYGALSTHDGRISVRWHWPLNGKVPDRLVIEWQEIGGPAVQVPSRSGHGMEVIRDLVPYELDGTVDLAFASEGVRCRVDIPVVPAHQRRSARRRTQWIRFSANQFVIAHQGQCADRLKAATSPLAHSPLERSVELSALRGRSTLQGRWHIRNGARVRVHARVLKNWAISAQAAVGR